MKLKLHLLTALVGSLGALVLAPSASAQRIDNRAELNALLGGNQTMEDFESFNLPPDAFVALGMTLDDTSLVQGQGPDLVEDGATYFATQFGIQWLGSDRFDTGSQTIRLRGPDNGRITYSSPVSAMGLDLINNRDLTPYEGRDEATLFVYDTSGALVDSFTTRLGRDQGDTTFVGFQHLPGIGFVELMLRDEYYFVLNSVIDNHGYGDVPVEPGILADECSGIPDQTSSSQETKRLRSIRTTASTHRPPPRRVGSKAGSCVLTP